MKVSAGQFKKLFLHTAYKMNTVTGRWTCYKSSHITETIISTKDTVLKTASMLLIFLINTSTLSNEPEMLHNAGKSLLSLALEFETTLITLSWNQCIVYSFPSAASCQSRRPVTPLIDITWPRPTSGFTVGTQYWFPALADHGNYITAIAILFPLQPSPHFTLPHGFSSCYTGNRHSHSQPDMLARPASSSEKSWHLSPPPHFPPLRSPRKN